LLKLFIKLIQNGKALTQLQRHMETSHTAITRIIVSLILMSMEKLMFNVSVKIFMFNVKEEAMRKIQIIYILFIT